MTAGRARAASLIVALALVVVAAVWAAGRPSGESGGSAPGPSASVAPTPEPALDLGAAEPPEPFGSGDRLRVREVDGQDRLVAADGRPVLLRGASVNALVDYGRTGDAPVAFGRRDPGQMAVLGLNVMRLAVSWSRVMPEPGRLDRDYLRQIRTLVRRAGRERIHTVISMHGDRYAADLGTGTEFDGAPRWAVETDGLPCGDPRPRYYTPCAAAAARHFYRGDRVAGRSGLDLYADAVVAVAAAGRGGGPGYAGTDILNEPTDPDANPDAAATPRWTRQLHALQRRIVARLRADGERAPIWIQPQGPRSTAEATAAELPPLDDRQLVYAPHAYIDVYDGVPTAGTAGRMRAQYRAFGREARRLRAATVVGEFPGATGGPWEELRAEHLLRQRRSGFGGIAWLWKQPAGGYGWGTLQPDGALRAGTQAAQVLAAPRLLRGPRGVTITQTGAGTVDVEADDGGLVDLWLGLQLGDEAGATYRATTVPADGTTRVPSEGTPRVEGHWATRADLGGTPAAGTTLRLRLPPGPATVRIARVD